MPVRPDRYDAPDSHASPRLSAPNLPQPSSVTGKAGGRLTVVAAVVVVLVILAGTIVFGVVMFRNPAAAATLRDIFLIILGVQSIVVALLMVVLLAALVYVALKLHGLTQFVQTELKPILERADDTMRTVHSRTVFVSDSAVKPVIEVMAYVSAVKSIIRSFTRSTR
jgi:hypothetical protein